MLSTVTAKPDLQNKFFVSLQEKVIVSFPGSFFDSGKILEGVLILRNSSLKLKTDTNNTILLNYAISSENISERIKIQTENGFYLKALFPTWVGKGK